MSLEVFFEVLRPVLRQKLVELARRDLPKQFGDWDDMHSVGELTVYYNVHPTHIEISFHLPTTPSDATNKRVWTVKI
jgi:hypothetical protein